MGSGLNISDVRPVDPVQTRIAIEYAQSKTMFIHDKLFPAISTNGQESGTYYTWSSSKEMFTLPDVGVTKRAPGTLYPRFKMASGKSSYDTVQDGAEVPVDDRIQAAALPPYDPRSRATKLATNIILLRREKNCIEAITNSTTFASYTAAFTAAEQWSNANSDPVGKVDALKETVRGNCGMNPNVIVIAYDVWLKLKEHPSILDRLKVTSDQVVTRSLVEKLFFQDDDVTGRLLISRASYNSAEEGQTVSLADMMTKQMFMGYVAPSPSIEEPSVGYLLQAKNLEAVSYYENQSDSTISKVRINEVQKIVAADCGYYSSSVIA